MSELQTYLEEIKARLDNATPGKWKSFAGVLRTEDGLVGCNDPDLHATAIDDSILIASAPTDLKILVEMVEHVTHQLSEHGCFCDEMDDCDIQKGYRCMGHCIEDGFNKIIAKHRGDNVNKN